jgi:hypothetical protein
MLKSEREMPMEWLGWERKCDDASALMYRLQPTMPQLRHAQFSPVEEHTAQGANETLIEDSVARTLEDEEDEEEEDEEDEEEEEAKPDGIFAAER